MLVTNNQNLYFLLVPTKPLKLRAFNVSSQELNVSWNEPERPNGILTGYTVYYKLLRNDKNDSVPQATWKTKNNVSERSVLLSNLGKFVNDILYGICKNSSLQMNEYKLS